MRKILDSPFRPMSYSDRLDASDGRLPVRDQIHSGIQWAGCKLFCLIMCIPFQKLELKCSNKKKNSGFTFSSYELQGQGQRQG